MNLYNIFHNIVKRFSVDYVVEQGTSGIWYYKKWNSGYYEAYALEAIYVDYGGTIGNQYYSQSWTVNWAHTLTQIYACVITIGNSGAPASGKYESGLNATSGNFSLLMNQAWAGYISVSYSLHGRWK